MKISTYTLPYKISNESFKINRLFEDGLDELHLKKVTLNKSELRTLLHEISTIYHSKIVLHSHTSLIREFNLKGIYVNKSFFSGILGKMKYIFQFRNRNFKIFTSIDPLSNKQISISYFDEILVGSIFKKYSEKNIKMRINIFELKRFILKLDKPFNFFGGINTYNFDSLTKLNPNGIVLLSSIWKSDNIFNSFNSFILKRNLVLNESGKHRQTAL